MDAVNGLIALGVGALAGALAGVATAWLIAPRVYGQHRDSLAVLVTDIQARVAAVLDQVETWARRGSEERARVETTAHRRATKQQADAPKYSTVADYKRALERGQPRDPATERALGWQ